MTEGSVDETYWLPCCVLDEDGAHAPDCPRTVAVREALRQD